MELAMTATQASISDQKSTQTTSSCPFLSLCPLARMMLVMIAKMLRQRREPRPNFRRMLIFTLHKIRTGMVITSGDQQSANDDGCDWRHNYIGHL